MKMKHAGQCCAVLLFGLLSSGIALAVQWPVHLEGTAATKNVVFESFLRKG